jgi:dTDP-4-dehydrorhamnose 3,5-epimerase
MIHTFIPSAENQLPSGIHQTAINGLWYIPHQVNSDHRGFYAEVARIPEIETELGETFIIKQINLSHSAAHVIRGFHAESWHKLLTVVQGECFCAWVDIRPESPTFKEVVTMTVGNAQPALFGSVFVSSGIANSFCVTRGPVDYMYGVNSLYKDRDKSGDVAISLFDPELAVPWPLAREQMVVSDRDLAAVTWQERFGHGK